MQTLELQKGTEETRALYCCPKCGNKQLVAPCELLNSADTWEEALEAVPVTCIACAAPGILSPRFSWTIKAA